MPNPNYRLPERLRSYVVQRAYTLYNDPVWRRSTILLISHNIKHLGYYPICWRRTLWNYAYRRARLEAKERLERLYPYVLGLTSEKHYDA